MGNVRARETTEAIDRIYVSMRHLFHRGYYKPGGASGKTLRELLLEIEPEIYGSMANPNKVELNGLLYVLDRLPEGIEQCAFIHLTSDEGFEKGSFEPIFPKKRRRTCYRIDEHQMNIEVLLGRSDIYDILTHLTFLTLEADKIRDLAFDLIKGGKPSRIWRLIEDVALDKKAYTRKETEVAIIQLSGLLGRSFDETLDAYNDFAEEKNPHRLFKVIYWMGMVSLYDWQETREREIYFSSILQERVGHHFFGEKWAKNVKRVLIEHQLQERPLHVISANMHSVKNLIFANDALGEKVTKSLNYPLYEKISSDPDLQKKISAQARKNGIIKIDDDSGSNVNVQIIDLSKTDLKNTFLHSYNYGGDDVILVFDYAFGEQAFEVMDELLRPFVLNETTHRMNVKSISIMGKAGILTGNKGDIMIPRAHIHEGSADNYVFNNALSKEDFKNEDLQVCEGNMITVLGTSLQNKDILKYFMNTTWRAIGIEMEGAHYQKAIQIASKVRNHIDSDLFVCYAYYASDNPIQTGSTLSSGALGLTGVKPTYMITAKILEKIIGSSVQKRGNGE